MKILMVGGHGFIGSHLGHIIKTDYMDIKYNRDFFDWTPKKYDVIVFLAAKLDFTTDAYKYNHELYIALDNYMNLYPKTHVIFTSSCFVYGSNFFAKETDLIKTSNIYGQSKILGEYFVKRYKNHTIFRLSNVYGEGGHSAIDKFLAGGNTIHGDGKQERDYVPVEYVVQSIKYAIDNQIFGIYNIGSGIRYTVNEIHNLFGSDKPKFDKKADIGLRGVGVDCSKWKQIYGY